MNPLRKQTFLLFLIFYLFTWKISAQDIRFQKLTINEGLSQNVVFSITQDSDGFMWFATKDGLNKYDGYSFSIYQHDPSDKKTVASNYISTLFTDKNGRLWVGTLNGVLHLYSKETNDFQRIYLPLAAEMSKNSNEITTIAQDKNGTIWVGTKNNGIFKVPFENEKFNFGSSVQIKRNPTTTNLSANSITKLLIDDQNILWIATTNGLTRMDIKKETFLRYYFDVQHKSTIGEKKEFGIGYLVQDEASNLWLGSPSGLIHFNTKNFSYDFYPHHLSIFRYGWGSINSIVADKDENLWLATPAELMRFDIKKKTYESFKNDPLRPESLNYNSISSLFIDHSNILWVGTTGMGINYYDPKSNRFGKLNRKEFLNSRIPGFSVNAIVEENDRFVWIGAEVLYRWDRKTGELKSFESSSNNLKNFGNTRVSSLKKTKDNMIWICSTEGLFRYTPKTQEVKLFTYEKNNPNSLPSVGASSLFESKTGTLWVLSKNHLSKMIDVASGTFKNYNYKSVTNVEPNFLDHSYIYEDEKNNLWIATKDGLLVFNPENESFHTYKNNPENATSISNNSVNTICPDPYHPSEFLWIGTSSGLNLFDKKKQTFTNFTQKDGLPNNVIYGILTDANNNLWLSTNKGISKFNSKEKKFRNYDIYDGLQSNEFNTGAFYKSDKGELFFGGISGLNYFFPEQIKDNPYLPSVAITGIKVFSESKTNKTHTAIKDITSRYDNLKFTHRDNIIVFEFASLDFSAISKNNFAFKLENFNDSWIYNNTNRSATFTNLPPGKYIFKVKGTNNDGIWNEKETTLAFQVLPHWTGTWWAYSSYFILLLFALYLIRNYELRRLKLKAKIQADTKENETLRNLDQLKTQFFTNISHELRTPLTLIRGNIEQALEEHHPINTRRQLSQIEQNTNQLLRLINQLLDISKLEAGEMQLNNAPHDIVPFIHNLVHSIESICEIKGITVRFISESPSLYAQYDEEKMEKVIMNLLSNAVKFSNENGTIEVSVATRNSKFLVIKVSDTGIGIKPSAIPHIFNRFYQADNSDTKKFEGTGIGLTLVKELIELHNGQIKVVSNENKTNKKGTTFEIEIPIGTLDATILKDEEKLPRKEKLFHNEELLLLNPSRFKNSKEEPKKIVLLVEDNFQIRSFIHQQLKDKYKVIEAENGKEGITKAQKNIPDIIIADIMMPEMDGYEMVRTLKKEELTSHIPIIMLTGRTTLDDKIKGLEYGVEAYISKPFSSKELKITIANLIFQREQLRIKFQKSYKLANSEVQLTSIDELFLEKMIQHIKDNMDNSAFSVEALAQKMCISPSQLHRKTIALLDKSPGNLIRCIRLEHSADLLLHNVGNIAEICFQTGFSDQTYFSRAFKNQYGCSPSSYKKMSK
jgi:signal transduction histidine kinase/ligand-binding sensor domain-containing protein/DNA-binding response OmpR family regulator